MSPNAKKTIITFLIVSTGLLGSAAMPGCDRGGRISKVKSVVVRISTATGQWIETNAKSVYDGAAALWREIYGREKNTGGTIEIDPRDPLKGTSVRDYEYRVVEIDHGKRSSEVHYVLRKPTFRRSTESSEDWILDKSNFPPDFTN